MDNGLNVDIHKNLLSADGSQSHYSGKAWKQTQSASHKDSNQILLALYIGHVITNLGQVMSQSPTLHLE